MTTYWKINSKGERVQMSDEEVAVGISSISRDPTKTQYIADRTRASTRRPFKTIISFHRTTVGYVV